MFYPTFIWLPAELCRTWIQCMQVSLEFICKPKWPPCLFGCWIMGQHEWLNGFCSYRSLVDFVPGNRAWWQWDLFSLLTIHPCWIWDGFSKWPSDVELWWTAGLQVDQVVVDDGLNQCSLVYFAPQPIPCMMIILLYWSLSLIPLNWLKSFHKNSMPAVVETMWWTLLIALSFWSQPLKRRS